MSEKNLSKRSRVSIVFSIVFLVILTLSIVSLYQATNAYLLGNIGEGNYLLMTGLSALATSAYLQFQKRKKTQRLLLKPVKVTTVIICEKCGLKRIRGFKKGDYIMKKESTCQECEENMLITSIYQENTKKSPQAINKRF